MRAVGVAARVGDLLLREGGELPPEHGGVRVDAVVGQLGEVEYLNVYAFLLQWPEDLLRHVHHAVVRGRAFVPDLLDRLRLVQALVAVVSAPVARPESLFMCEKIV